MSEGAEVPSAEQLQRFDDYLLVRDISETTRKRWIRSLEYLSSFFPVDGPSSDQIDSYIRRAKKKGNRNKTIENHLRALIHYNRMNGKVVNFPKQKKQPPNQQYVPTPEDVKKMLDYAGSVPNLQRSHLLTAIVLTAATTGCRVGELARLNVDDLRPKEGGIFIRAEKNESSRIVGVPEEIMSYLKEYKSRYRLKPSANGDKGLFISLRYEKNGPVTERYSNDGLRNLIREVAHSAGIQQGNSHSIRRFVATELFRQGAEFRRVQFHLGHREPKSTMAYVKLSEEVEARNNARLLRPFFRKILKNKVK